MAFTSYFGMGLEAAEQGLDFDDFAPTNPTHRQWYRQGFNDWFRVANAIEAEKARQKAEANHKGLKSVTRAAGLQ